MIDRLNRNSEYFQDKIEQEDKHIYAPDLDSQFNDIATYFNTTLKPAIDQLTSSAVQGVAGNIGAFLHNVGDGSTDWQKISSNNIEDYAITLTKLAKQAVGSVLTTNAAGELHSLAINTDNEVITSQAGNMPVWSSITDANIEEESLTGDKFGILSMENFQEDQFITNITPASIATANIRDLNITNAKLQDGIITSNKLGIFANLPLPATTINASKIADGAVSPDKVKDYSIPVTHNSNKQYMDIWGNVYGTYTEPNLGYVYKQILKSENILDNSIEDDLLPQILYLTNDRPQAERKEAARAFFSSVPLAFQFQSRHIRNDSLDLDSFDQEVQNAINRL